MVSAHASYPSNALLGAANPKVRPLKWAGSRVEPSGESVSQAFVSALMPATAVSEIRIAGAFGAGHYWGMRESIRQFQPPGH